MKSISTNTDHRRGPYGAIRKISLLLLVAMLLAGCQKKPKTNTKKPKIDATPSQSESDVSSNSSDTSSSVPAPTSGSKSSLPASKETNTSSDTVQDNSVNRSFVPDAYKLVWGDEFDGDTLDSSKWMINKESKSPSFPDLLYLDTPNVLKISNGLLQMNAIHYFDPMDPLPKYATSKSLLTSGTMNYRYGYLEMCAKVPYKNGAWPAFWLCNTKDRDDVLVEPACADYKTEVDVFEVFSSVEKAVPNMHKWYHDSNGKYTGGHVEFKNDAPYYFTDTYNLPNEYHVYGFEWTPEYMAMYIDGEKYMTYDITDKGNFDLDGYSTDMSGFHDPMFIILDNAILTPLRTVLAEGNQTEWTINNSNLPLEYSVDWIHLYQNPAVKESGLWKK